MEFTPIRLKPISVIRSPQFRSYTSVNFIITVFEGTQRPSLPSPFAISFSTSKHLVHPLWQSRRNFVHSKYFFIMGWPRDKLNLPLSEAPHFLSTDRSNRVSSLRGNFYPLLIIPIQLIWSMSSSWSNWKSDVEIGLVVHLKSQCASLYVSSWLPCRKTSTSKIQNQIILQIMNIIVGRKYFFKSGEGTKHNSK